MGAEEKSRQCMKQRSQGLVGRRWVQKRVPHLEGTVQQVHLPQLVALGEMQLSSNAGVLGLLLQGFVQSLECLAESVSSNTDKHSNSPLATLPNLP